MAKGAEKRRRQELHLEALRKEREETPGPELPMSQAELAMLVDHLDEWRWIEPYRRAAPRR